ncbi:MAG: hypothetical protein LBB24_02360 [Rickettsiales bacterium]|jgi:hypothetical protein|nr:hypothetical protein [Rickettsiales bacterium]
MSEQKTEDKLDRDGNRLSRKIFRIDKERGELEEKEEVTSDDIKLLRETGLLEEIFKLDDGYFPPQFVEQLIESIREKYPELMKDLPITFANCSNIGITKTDIEEGSGLTILYGHGHTVLVTRRQLDSGRTEIYVMDSYGNSANHLINNTYGDPDKFTIKYPSTELSIKNRDVTYGPILREFEKERREKLEELHRKMQEEPDEEERKKLQDIHFNTKLIFEKRRGQLNIPNLDRLGIQMDSTHCISYAIRFAEKMYKTVKTEMKKNGTDNVIESFGEVMDRLKNYREMLTEEEKATEKEERNMFLMPDFLLENSGSEETLNTAIEARNIGDEEERGKLEKQLKRKILPYKKKRQEERENRLTLAEKTLNEMRDTVEKLKRDGNGEKNREEIEEYEDKIEEKLHMNALDSKCLAGELSNEFSPARNWRNKHLKKVANQVRKGKQPIQPPSTVLAHLSGSTKVDRMENLDISVISVPNTPATTIVGKGVKPNGGKPF